MSKKHCLKVELLPHDVIERILERLPVISLLRFKAVSKQWKSTIESQFFQERQLLQRQESGDPDVLMESIPSNYKNVSLRTLAWGSPSWIEIHSPWEKKNQDYLLTHSIDGLVCLYHTHPSGFLINPTTRWHRTLPLSELQKLRMGLLYHTLGLFKLGFGKDNFTGTYKPVWLYNSAPIGLENATTCEVFDFTKNTWRYVTPAAPYRVVGFHIPVFVDGSLHWLTDCKETKVVSFDLHTETFQVLAKVPFVNEDPIDDMVTYHIGNIVMCDLDSRLCVSEKKWPNQVTWSFDSSSKTWDKICSIDLNFTLFWFGIPPYCDSFPLFPLALLDGEKKKTKMKTKVLFYYHNPPQTLVTYDLETKYFDAADVFRAKTRGHAVCYFQSLISI